MYTIYCVHLRKDQKLLGEDLTSLRVLTSNLAVRGSSPAGVHF